MSTQKNIIAGALILFMLAGAGLAQTVEVTQVNPNAQVMIAKRTTLAIQYPEGNGTEVNMMGTPIFPQATGKADIKRKEGRTRIILRMKNMGHPQALGSYYTTYVVWAIAPEGQAENLAELPIKNEFDYELTTTFQTFGLIITAEPYSMVKLPSPVIVAENSLRKGTEGIIEASQIEYRGDAGTLYIVSSPNNPSLNADYSTPLLVLGARRAVEIARRAGAQEYAEPELRQAEVKLAALEQFWPRERRDEKKFSGLAHDVMRIAEHARTLTVERTEQARLDAERRAAERTIAQAHNEADRAKDEAERARMAADAYRDAMDRAEKDAAAARLRAEQAQNEADRAKANEELARLEAEQARLKAEQAQREKDELQQRLFTSITAILEARREARGIIVNLSDVLFDFDKATLKPGAREKLAKLAGILTAYPGNYRLDIEGHTDAVGSDEYNLKLSQERADTVRYYLVQSGIAQDRIIGARGFGEVRPVASNDTAEGRQMNRRVEIVIADLDNR